MTHTILIIRHAEKPDHGHRGVDANGHSDHESLTPRGWLRAGAWTELLVPSLSNPCMPAPQRLFAAAPRRVANDPDASKSQRPLQTITQLSQKLGIPVNLEHSRGQETQLAAVLSRAVDVALVCWQHESIAAILKALTPVPAGYPSGWPDDRFNVMFKLTRSGADSPWIFQQLSPVMLDGDDPNPI
jgi:hypothetical protein